MQNISERFVEIHLLARASTTVRFYITSVFQTDFTVSTTEINYINILNTSSLRLNIEPAITRQIFANIFSSSINKYP